MLKLEPCTGGGTQLLCRHVLCCVGCCPWWHGYLQPCCASRQVRFIGVSLLLAHLHPSDPTGAYDHMRYRCDDSLRQGCIDSHRVCSRKLEALVRHARCRCVSTQAQPGHAPRHTSQQNIDVFCQCYTDQVSESSSRKDANSPPTSHVRRSIFVTETVACLAKSSLMSALEIALWRLAALQHTAEPLHQ